MTKEFIKFLAMKCAEENYSKFGNREAIGLMAGEYESVIEIIGRDYNIIPR